LKEY
jgi:ribonuclease HI